MDDDEYIEIIDASPEMFNIADVQDSLSESRDKKKATINIWREAGPMNAMQIYLAIKRITIRLEAEMGICHDESDQR